LPFALKSPMIESMSRLAFRCLLIFFIFSAALTALPCRAVASSNLGELTTKPLPILAVGDDFIRVRSLDTLGPGQNFLIVRPVDDDDPEVVANGRLKSQIKNEVIIEFDPALAKKRPINNDFVILLGKPKVFNPIPKGKKSDDTDFSLLQVKNKETGYLQFKYFQGNTKLDSSSPNQANSLKNISKFPRAGFELEWFMEFLPNYGFSIGEFSGEIPIVNYFHTPVPGTFTQSKIKLMYRTEKSSTLRGQLFMQSQSEKFATANSDEYILSTQVDVSALGASLVYERGELLPITKTWSFGLTALRLNLIYGLSVVAQDGSVSRGQSSGGNGFQEIQLGLDTTGYFPKIPYLKRWTFGLDFYQRTLDLKFTGKTKGEQVTGAYVIPSDQKYSEIESGVYLYVGFRFKDVIGSAFKPRE
jgi:hypothetical protein